MYHSHPNFIAFRIEERVLLSAAELAQMERTYVQVQRMLVNRRCVREKTYCAEDEMTNRAGERVQCSMNDYRRTYVRAVSRLARAEHDVG